VSGSHPLMVAALVLVGATLWLSASSAPTPPGGGALPDLLTQGMWGVAALAGGGMFAAARSVPPQQAARLGWVRLLAFVGCGGVTALLARGYGPGVISLGAILYLACSVGLRLGRRR